MNEEDACGAENLGWAGLVNLHLQTVGVQQLLGALDRLEPKLKKRQNDLQFLRGLLRSSDFNVLMKVREL